MSALGQKRRRWGSAAIERIVALAQRCQIVVQKAEVVSDDEGSDDDNEEGDKENYALAFVFISLRL